MPHFPSRTSPYCPIFTLPIAASLQKGAHLLLGVLFAKYSAASMARSLRLEHTEAGDPESYKGLHPEVLFRFNMTDQPLIQMGGLG